MEVVGEWGIFVRGRFRLLMRMYAKIFTHALHVMIVCRYRKQYENLPTYLHVDHHGKDSCDVRWLHAMPLHPLSLLASGLKSLFETTQAYRAGTAATTDTCSKRRQHF